MPQYSQAWRALVRRPSFAVLAIATLAIGIAVTTTAFSVVDGVVLRPLPYPHPQSLVAVTEASPARRERVNLIAPARLEDWQRLNQAFTAIAGSYTESVTDTSGSDPERLSGRRVTPGFFDVYGMPPLEGRSFTAAEERDGGPAAAVISEDFWTRRFARATSAIGARLTIGGVGHSIVGVMPRAFSSAPVDVWLPAQMGPGLRQSREARFLSGIGRLKPGVSVTQGRDDLVRVQSLLAEQFPATDKGWSVDVRDLKDVRVGEYRRPLWIVFGAVAVLFAIAVANIAGLVLVQLQRRAPEFAIRAAIGASRPQLIAAVLRELLIIAIAGAAAGAAIAFWLTPLAASAMAAMPRASDVAVDARALAVAIGATLTALAVFGVIPSIVASQARLSPALMAAGRGTTGGRHRLQAALVILQLALGVALAGGAGLLARSYSAVSSVDPGFSTSGVVTFHAGASWDEDRTRVAQFQVRLLEALRTLPGVRAAGFTNFLPAPGGTLRSQVTVDGVAGDDAGGTLTVGQRTIAPGYLRALSVPLIAGRWCEETRADFGERRVRDALVNRAFVDRYAPGQNLVGRRLGFSQQGFAAFTVAGVVGDVHEDGPAMPAVPYVYACLAGGSWPDPEYVVRADGDARALAPAIRAAVKSLDSTRPVFGLTPLAAVMDAALEQPRLNAAALTLFAAVAVGLSALGLYGLMMLAVAQRRRELAVRLALGASPRDLVVDVLAGAGRLIGPGLLMGIVLFLLAGQSMRALLFGIAPYDVTSLAISVVVLALATVAAAAVPARLASRANAVEAMRQS